MMHIYQESSYSIDKGKVVDVLVHAIEKTVQCHAVKLIHVARSKLKQQFEGLKCALEIILTRSGSKQYVYEIIG